MSNDTWWCISGEELLDAFQRVAAGKDPDVMYSELLANSQIEHVPPE